MLVAILLLRDTSLRRRLNCGMLTCDLLVPKRCQKRWSTGMASKASRSLVASHTPPTPPAHPRPRPQGHHRPGHPAAVLRSPGKATTGSRKDFNRPQQRAIGAADRTLVCFAIANRLALCSAMKRLLNELEAWGLRVPAAHYCIAANGIPCFRSPLGAPGRLPAPFELMPRLRRKTAADT